MRIHLCLILLLWAAFLAIPGLPVQAQASRPLPDVLIFTNGDQLTGKLERAVGGSLLFKSDMAGEINVPFSKVKEVRSGSQFAVIRKDAPLRGVAADVGILHLSTNKVAVQEPADAPERTIPAAQVAFIIDRHTYDRSVARRAGPFEGWTGAATGGITLVRATQTASTFTAAASLRRSIPVVPYLPARNRSTLNITETYGSQTTPIIPQTTPPTGPSVVLTNIFHADTERDEYYSRKFYALGDAAFDHNFAQGLQLQQVYGAGVGWTPLQNGKQQLDLKAEMHYERQGFLMASGNLDLVGSTFSESYRRTLPREVLFTETGDYLPAWNATRAYSANITGSLTMPIFKRLGATLTTTDNYLNNPSPGYRRNSLQFVTGLTYTLP